MKVPFTGTGKGHIVSLVDNNSIMPDNSSQRVVHIGAIIAEDIIKVYGVGDADKSVILAPMPVKPRDVEEQTYWPLRDFHVVSSKMTSLAIIHLNMSVSGYTRICSSGQSFKSNKCARQRNSMRRGNNKEVASIARQLLDLLPSAGELAYMRQLEDHRAMCMLIARATLN